MAPRKADNVPGPGTYNAEKKQRPFTTVFGKSHRNAQRSESVSSGFPGPGSYTPKSKRGTHWSFGSSTRAEKARDQVPGPGNYEI